jgi:hypothetical protein
MTAKRELFERLKYLGSAVDLPELIDQGIAVSEHNGRANLLRKGLGIVAFNILEDFVKNRSLEALTFLSNSTVAFSNLPSKLQEASTLNAMSAILFRAKLDKRAGRDWLGLVQNESLKVHSTQNPTYELSKYSLVSGSSNISPEEIQELLSAFGISGGWATLKMVSDKIGGGIPDLSQSYKNAAERRHNSAHSAAFQYDHQWLTGIKDDIITIAASLDILLCAMCRKIQAKPTEPLERHDLSSALGFRFLEPSAGKFRETGVIGGRAKKIWISSENAVASLQPGLVAKGEFLIVLSQAKRVADWHS